MSDKPVEDGDENPTVHLPPNATKFTTFNEAYTSEELGLIITRHYLQTPGGKERITARMGPFQATTIWIHQYASFPNHQRAAYLLCVKHGLGGEWLAYPRGPHSWVFVYPDVGKKVKINPWR